MIPSLLAVSVIALAVSVITLAVAHTAWRDVRALLELARRENDPGTRVLSLVEYQRIKRAAETEWVD